MRDKSVNGDIRSLNVNNLDFENQSHVSYLEAQRSPIFKRDARNKRRETRCERQETRDEMRDARCERQETVDFPFLVQS